MKNPILAFAVLVTIFFSGCTDDVHHVNYMNDNISEAMDTLCFSKGTYWVYRNELDNSTDCVYVASTLHDYYTVEFIQDMGVIREYFKMNLTNKSGEKSVLWIEGTRMVENPTTNIPYAEGAIIYSADTTNDWKYTSHVYVDSVMIYDNIYYHLQKTVGRDGTTYFVNQEYGIVKKTRDSNTWNLIRYDLLRENL